ncbi:hypothetical protein H9L39_08081 [Fusarium oxysporum f. sp. albedinis]|nr:hypothetical protein H9L39_08081 [Fusarium oxysporum f. sp. albedinis]
MIIEAARSKGFFLTCSRHREGIKAAGNVDDVWKSGPSCSEPRFCITLPIHQHNDGISSLCYIKSLENMVSLVIIVCLRNYVFVEVWALEDPVLDCLLPDHGLITLLPFGTQDGTDQ